MKKIRVFWNLEEEEQWLNEMNEEGYEFIEKTGCCYNFRKANKKGKFRYCIDVRRIRNTDFREFMESLDIKLVSKNLMLYYYQIPKDCGIQSLYTDSKDKIFLYLRYILCLMIIGCINILILYDANGPFLLNISIPFMCNLIMLIIVVYAIVRYIKNIVTLIL